MHHLQTGAYPQIKLLEQLPDRGAPKGTRR
uniref:Uncharacterized protein n=1 Tax=Arundo donax TaxID=35708 RepID=A0A0A9EAH3_ARUDO